MLDRFTDKAKRVLFFARLEAGQCGSHEIDTEHLLLGLLHAAKGILAWAPGLTADEVKNRIDAHTLHLPSIATNVDLPLSQSAQDALKHAQEEADGLGHKYIGTEHLFLGILGVGDSFAAKLLREGGADEEKMRQKLGARNPE